MAVRLALALMALAISNPSFAKAVTTSYLSLDIPDAWTCETIEPSWVCRSTVSSEQNSAVLVITAKTANPEEHLKNLKAQLARPRTVKGPKGAIFSSRLEWSREISLKGQAWLEAQQKNSEIYGFNSYYLTTVANGKTILVNFNYEALQAKSFFPLITKIRDSIILKATEEDDVFDPLPQGQLNPPAPPQAPSAPAELPLTKRPLFWVATAALVCLLLLALLW